VPTKSTRTCGSAVLPVLDASACAGSSIGHVRTSRVVSHHQSVDRTLFGRERSPSLTTCSRDRQPLTATLLSASLLTSSSLHTGSQRSNRRAGCKGNGAKARSTSEGASAVMSASQRCPEAPSPGHLPRLRFTYEAPRTSRPALRWQLQATQRALTEDRAKSGPERESSV
jgi:hypothetical protein